MFTSRIKICLVIIGISLFTLVPVFSGQKVAEAQKGNPLLVQIGSDMDFNSIMDNMKEFILDKAAYLVAKQILHQMTTSIVNWINSGFEGNPAFITDPSGFFLDAADQVTGEFLANEGALSQLCGPFSLDIRLNLALNQVRRRDARYYCTLGRIVNNTVNAVNTAGQNSGITINNTQSFIDGNFSQGGWPAFISYTTEMQNNPVGAYLLAEDDLRSRINARSNSINVDLDRGQGFLSFNKCEDRIINANGNVGASDLGLSQQDMVQLDNTGKVTAANGAGSFKTRKNATGQTVYQKCSVQTPGSVIAGTVNKAVQSPIVEAELADSINSILNALVSQMINQMLTGGLRSLSGGGGGSYGGNSYTNAIIRDINSPTSASNQDFQNTVQAQFQVSVKSVIDYKTAYDQAVTVVSDSKTKLRASQVCISNKITVGTLSNFQERAAQFQVRQIDQLIIASVDPLLASMITKQTAAATKLENLQNNLSTTTATSVQELQNQVTQYASTISQTTAPVSTEEATAAQNDLKNAQTKAAQWSADAARYQANCTNTSFI